MKILMVSSYLPYPLFSGGHIRLYNLLKGLSKEHEITLICEKRPYQTEQDMQEVKKLCKDVICVPRKKQWTIQNILATLFSPNAFVITGHINKPLRDAITEELSKNSFDLIHVETSYVFQNIPHTSLPTVLVEHNIEYLVYKRYADNAPIFMRPFLYGDVLKLKRTEKNFWKRATQVVAVSEDEKKIIGDKTIVVPNGVDLNRFRFKTSDIEQRTKNKEKRILFIGDFKWLQNRDAASWILKEVWPRLNSELRTENLELKLWVVGRNIPDTIKNLAANDQNIIIDENADDTAKIFEKAFVLLAPIRVGGGTSYKILEAMASGVPVVTTPIGIEGIKASDGKEILLGETTQDFVLLVQKLLNDPKYYISITKNARAVIEKEYDWNMIVKKLETVYQSVVQS